MSETPRQALHPNGETRVSTKMLDEANFQIAFEQMQQGAAEINRNNFSGCDGLMDEFEQWFKNFPSIDLAEQNRYRPLFDAFRDARAGLKLALVMSELGETLEAVRKNLGPDDHIPGFSTEEAEVADAVIRLMNYASDRKLRLAEAVIAKNNYNRTRADHSKEARESEHGKRF